MQTTNIHKYLELLEAFRIGLQNGLLGVKEVTQWADCIIMQDEQPDYFVIEPSLCHNLNDMVSLLNAFVGEPKPQIPDRVILGFLFKELIQQKITLRKVTGTMYWMYLHTNLTGEESNFMYTLDDYLDHAEQGDLGSVEDVRKDTLRFLEIYKEFSLDNFDKWHEINQTIDEKLMQLSIDIATENEQFQKAIEKQQRKTWWKFWKK